MTFIKLVYQLFIYSDSTNGSGLDTVNHFLFATPQRSPFSLPHNWSGHVSILPQGTLPSSPIWDICSLDSQSLGIFSMHAFQILPQCFPAWRSYPKWVTPNSSLRRVTTSGGWPDGGNGISKITTLPPSKFKRARFRQPMIVVGDSTELRFSVPALPGKSKTLYINLVWWFGLITVHKGPIRTY